MEPEELRIEETDMRELIERLTRTGVPQKLDTLAQWYVEIVVGRLTSR